MRAQRRRSRILAVGLLLCGIPAAHAGEPVVKVTPATKTEGPLGLEVVYPARHPVGKALKVEVTVWSSDDADELSVVVRPPAEIAWKKGKREGVWRGVKAHARRTLAVSIAPEKAGTHLVAVDVARTASGKVAHRTGAFLIEGDGEVRAPVVPAPSK